MASVSLSLAPKTAPGNGLKIKSIAPMIPCYPKIPTCNDEDSAYKYHHIPLSFVLLLETHLIHSLCAKTGGASLHDRSLLQKKEYENQDVFCVLKFALSHCITSSSSSFIL
jgi:hypothetical protein